MIVCDGGLCPFANIWGTSVAVIIAIQPRCAPIKRYRRISSNKRTCYSALLFYVLRIFLISIIRALQSPFTLSLDCREKPARDLPLAMLNGENILPQTAFSFQRLGPFLISSGSWQARKNQQSNTTCGNS